MGFNQFLLEAVDEGLSSLGESSKQAIYFHLQGRFNIDRTEIPSKIEDFVEAIDEIFGFGANFLKILIMQRLGEKIGGTIEWPKSKEFTFSEFVTMAKQVFQEKSKITIIEKELTECEKEEIKV